MELLFHGIRSKGDDFRCSRDEEDPEGAGADSRKSKGQYFNSLEVTGIVEGRFLGVPYAVVSAHSRHVQQSCYLDSAEARRTSQHDVAWARG